ncbi:MAG TPA: haloacid dehalogenase [Sphingobacteriaceae bacterium]|nr:haloacid dehalogenase [Sphingobacteriaceae bacterium]
MLTYSDINPDKKAFIFELDNVVYPEKDYLLQVYYLFANFIEYTETIPSAAELINFMKLSYETQGADGLFEKVQIAFGLNGKYNTEFERLHQTARLPLKLLLYQNVLDLLQEIVINRKHIFIITNGDPEQQLNKIRQIEWNGLEKYLTVYFANELKPKPETYVLDEMLSKHPLLRKELMIFGASETDREFAFASGIDYIDINSA